MYNLTDVDNCLSAFYNIIFHCFLVAIPIIKKTMSKSKSPNWYDDSLREIRNSRNKAWLRYSKSKSDEDYYNYSKLRKDFKDYAQEAYLRHLAEVQNKIRYDPKYFWNFVNSKKKGDGYPNCMSHNNQSSYDPAVISNLFANFFAFSFNSNDIGNDLNSSYLSSCLSSSPSVNFNSFTIDENSLLKHVNQLDSSPSTGPDGVPNLIVKNCYAHLEQPLLFIFNLSLSVGVFPNAWKSCFIVPVFKKGKKDQVANYRPIAKLSAIPKLFESIVCEFLSFQCKSVINYKQHGFTKGRSTATNLVALTFLYPTGVY